MLKDLPLFFLSKGFIKEMVEYFIISVNEDQNNTSSYYTNGYKFIL